MKVDGIYPDGPGLQLQPVGAVVEVTAVKGMLPDLFRGQRLMATVLEGNESQVLVNLQGAQVALPVSTALKPGTELLLRVASVTPQLLLEMIPSPARSQAQLPPLALGQAVDVAILEALPNGHARIDLQGTILEAAFAQGLPTQARVQATVEQLHPQLVLQVLATQEDPVQSEAIHLLRNTIAHRTPVSESWQTLLPALTMLTSTPTPEALPASATKLLALMKTLLLDSGPPTAEQVAAFVRDGGLLYEAKLQQEAELNPAGLSRVAETDIKGLLLQLTRDLDRTQTEPRRSTAGTQQAGTEEFVETSMLRDIQLQELSRALYSHLEHIENQQAVNLLARAQGEPYQLQIPLVVGQVMTTAFIAIDPERKGQEETTAQDASSEHGYHILFSLDLEELGQTRIEARVGRKSLWGAFYVEHPAGVAEIQAELPTFRTTLQALGYEEVLLLAKPLEQLSAEKRKKFDTLAGGVPSSVHLLDVRA